MPNGFLGHDRPLMTAMVIRRTENEAVEAIKRAVANGADAIGIQTESLLAEYHNPASYKRMFAAADGLPVYVTNYRSGCNENAGDDQIAEGLLELARSGATLCDIMGDLYDRRDQDQLTTDPRAVAKQMELVNKLHAEGAQVLMSTHHNHAYMPPQKVLDFAQKQKSRGVDIIKIVSLAENMEQQAENLKTIVLLKQNLGAPFLFLCGGECAVLRRVGPIFGCCMWLCVDQHGELDVKVQPPLKDIKTIKEQLL